MPQVSPSPFVVDGERCAADWFAPEADSLAGAGGGPAVVLGHGFSATAASGLHGFAERFAAAGIGALTFDYRHFAASEGEPRQLLSVARQLADYHGALAHVRGLEGVDPARVVLWGSSYAGAHVLQVGAEDTTVAAIVALTPPVDGVQSLLHLLRRDGPLAVARMTAAGLQDAARARAGRDPLMLQVVGAEGSGAVISGPNALASLGAIAGPDWRNEVCARVVLEVALHRPVTRAAELRSPVLIQVADLDTAIPTAPVAEFVRRAPGGSVRVRHYPADHFDVYPGTACYDAVVAHQLEFLGEVLAPAHAGRSPSQ